MKKKIFGVLLTIVCTVLLFFVGFDRRLAGDPVEVYQVYLDGKKIGLIESKDFLLNLIDKEQSSIKDEYKVDKVYPPNGLDIQKIYTYDHDLENVNNIYNQIKDMENFTIDGYVVTITYTEDKIINDSETIAAKDRPPVYVYILNRDILEDALFNTATAFIGTDNLNNYMNGTQVEITDTGEKITSVYFSETITVKKALISTEETILTNVEDLSQYLLYGNLGNHNKYTIKEGENLDSIAASNNLNIEELLIANPNYKTKDVLLTEGAQVNVDLINPLISVTYRKEIISDVDVQFKTEYVDDNSKYEDYKETTTEGQNGITRVTQDVKYVNGEIQSLQITQQEVLKAAVNEVIKRGTKKVGTFIDYNTVNAGDYSWPTLSPFIITSRFEWRWGTMHKGIDISGTGHGSPIFAIKEGVVTKVGYNSSEGNHIYIDHGNGVVSQYMHMSKTYVKVGQQVSKEQKIGAMGNTGNSFGTHLHLGIWLGGQPYQGGSTVVDPCKSVFKC